MYANFCPELSFTTKQASSSSTDQGGGKRDQTKVIDGTLVRVMSWYDNEWGFSNRMVDTAVAARLSAGRELLIQSSFMPLFRSLDDADVHEPFDDGTIEVAEAVAELTAAGKLVSFTRGGDTVAALNLASAKERMSHVSTGGGAFLESLERCQE
jgi:hypothetical protein